MRTRASRKRRWYPVDLRAMRRTARIPAEVLAADLEMPVTQLRAQERETAPWPQAEVDRYLGAVAQRTANRERAVREASEPLRTKRRTRHRVGCRMR